MKLIPLSQGKFSMVDDADFDFLNQWNWYANKIKGIWYARRSKPDGRAMMMHRLITGAVKRFEIVDHINHDGLDNRKENLRIVTNSENMKNQCPERRNEKRFWKKLNQYHFPSL